MELTRRIFSILAVIVTTNAYKILVVSPIPGKSHSILGDGIVRHLLNAGHEITYITASPPKKAHERSITVDVSANADVFKMGKILDLDSIINKQVEFSDIISVVNRMLDTGKVTLENPNVQTLLRNKNQQFDIIIAEWMYTDVYVGLSALFKCPLVWFSTMDTHWRILKLIDELPNPAYTTDPNGSSYPPFTFTERVKELGMQVFGQLLDQFFVNGNQKRLYDNIMVPVIRERGIEPPPYEDVIYNASLVLGNSHISLGIPMRLPDSYKNIGGYHIDENLKPLPKDMQNLLDNSKNGAIFFSMGSNVRSDSLPDKIKQDLLKVFGELKQTIIWKFEEDLPNRPKNVHIVQWAPQPSILAHKNCVLFITHGGLLSTTETVHYGVPIIGIPVFADQFMNVDRAVKKGFAKKVTLSHNLASDLKEAIKEILTELKYKQKVEELSLIYHDRPVTPGKELVHWVEHVVKTRGATHLRSPALLVSWYQKVYLDLAIVLLALVLGTTYAIKYLIRIRAKPNYNSKKKI